MDSRPKIHGCHRDEPRCQNESERTHSGHSKNARYPNLSRTDNSNASIWNRVRIQRNTRSSGRQIGSQFGTGASASGTRVTQGAASSSRRTAIALYSLAVGRFARNAGAVSDFCDQISGRTATQGRLLYCGFISVAVDPQAAVWWNGGRGAEISAWGFFVQ